MRNRIVRMIKDDYVMTKGAIGRRCQSELDQKAILVLLITSGYESEIWSRCGSESELRRSLMRLMGSVRPIQAVKLGCASLKASFLDGGDSFDIIDLNSTGSDATQDVTQNWENLDTAFDWQ